MKRVLAVLVLFLVLVSTSALAQDGSVSSPGVSSASISSAGVTTTKSGEIEKAKQFESKLAPPESDYSVAYLSQIFGTVGNVLQGSSGQILGKMFDIFNKGVLVIAALWLGMTTVQITIRAAQDGSAMGQNRSVMFTMLRVALGFSLIIPSSTTGYSLLQDIFMKIVVQGVGLADQTWDAALKYLQYGGSLYIPPGNLKSDADIVSNYLTKSSVSATPPFVAQIFQNEVCMLASAAWEKNANKQQSPKGSKSTPISTSGTYVDFHPVFDKKKGVVYFPGLGNSSDMSVSNYTLTPSSGGYSTNASCGYAMDYYNVQLLGKKSANPQGATAVPDEQTKMKEAYSFSALKQVVLSLQPAAQAYVDAYTSDPKYTTNQNNGLIQSNGKIAFSAILAYVNLMTPYQKMLGEGSLTNNFTQTAEDRGWIMAGSYYWRVEESNSKSSHISMSNLLPQTGAPSATLMKVHKSMLDNALLDGKTYKGATQCNGVTNANSTPGIQDSAQCVGYLWGQYVGAQQNDIRATSSGAAATKGTGSLASSMAGGALGNTISSIFGLTKSTYNPIAVLMHEGNKLLTAVVATWIGAILLSVLVSAGAGICASTSPGFLMAQTLVSWIKSILMLLTSVLLVPGAILAYYVPLYPFAVFTFASVGWLLMVVEGMAAAPLVCVGITHPEGHDFLGKGEQALMLFLGIFLRPALMVIGLIAAMVTSFVAFKMLNSGFAEVLASLSRSSQSAFGNDFLILISMAMVLVIFGMMTMELIEQCFKLIYQLPNYILKWIGGPQAGEEYGQMAQQVKGAVSPVAGLAQRGMDASGSKALDYADKTLNKNRESGGKGKIDTKE